ncbi:tumor necrosis factor receptor superfamily member 5-like isoform X2 [Lethenteron reissneri]|uniref:tumor necrosis factor receptor superfamily member 5-like isoform X2 n=1 Tax=Lethenteron reissneri TaxID=7753 RepID=UPI002AB6F0BC|nr:tumor necrosis factor receptor superfamily member 5-like isoform X2 [Lethenteron reissneri]
MGEYLFAITALTTLASFVVPEVGAPPMSHPHLEARGGRFLCDAVRGFREAQRCRADADTRCECREGRFCPSSPCQQELCEPHFACPAGTGVTQLGSAVMDTRCSACPPDFFSNETSATQTCRPHTRCDRDGRLTIANGTATRDSECGDRSLDPAREDERPGAVEVGHMHWIVPLSVAIFFTVIFACCFDCYKRKEPNNRFQANVIQVGNGNTVVHG